MSNSRHISGSIFSGRRGFVEQALGRWFESSLNTKEFGSVAAAQWHPATQIMLGAGFLLLRKSRRRVESAHRKRFCSDKERSRPTAKPFATEPVCLSQFRLFCACSRSDTLPLKEDTAGKGVDVQCSGAARMDVSGVSVPPDF